MAWLGSEKKNKKKEEKKGKIEQPLVGGREPILA